jgi:hypothetical protein
MNLFALTKGASYRVFIIPLSQKVQIEIESLFKHQEEQFNNYVENEIDFDGKYKPDDNECLKIENYEDIDNIHDAIASPLSVPQIDPNVAEFSTVKGLFVGYVTSNGDKVALIQKFDRRKIISSGGMSLIFSDNVYRKVDGVGLSLDTRLSAILINKSLRFFSFHEARQIFDLSQHYIEATNSDLDAFVKSEFLHSHDEPGFINSADSWIRRKVALVSQSQIIENAGIKSIKDAAIPFSIDIKTEIIDGKERIIIPSDKIELKKLLRFLDEDYYQSPIQSINYLTNSKRPA